MGTGTSLPELPDFEGALTRDEQIELTRQDVAAATSHPLRYGERHTWVGLPSPYPWGKPGEA